MGMTIHWTRRVLIRSALGGVLAILASGLGSVVLAADHPVDIAGFAFSPQTVTIAVGDTVTWTNADAQGHTATANDGSFDTGTIASNTSKSATFATAGTFAYHCKIHPTMTATIVVAGATPPPTDTVEPGQASPHGPPWALLVLAAMGGFLLGRRRFGRAVEASLED
jgi:MYXO-CTERM domain-containing protein